MPKRLGKPRRVRESLGLSLQQNQELKDQVSRLQRDLQVLQAEKDQLLVIRNMIKQGRMAPSSFKDFVWVFEEFAVVLSAKDLSYVKMVQPDQVQALKEELVVQVAKRMLAEGFIWFEQLQPNTKLTSPLTAFAVVGRPSGGRVQP